MSSDGESTIGGKEQIPDPKTQIELLRKYLRGERRSTYSNPGAIIFVARTSVNKAMEVIYTTGDLRGQRKYNNTEIDEMRAEFRRLEKLFERKNKGENIEREIDAPLSEEQIKEQKKELKTDDIKNPSEAPEIVRIRVLISEATTCYSKRDTGGAKQKFEKVIENFKKAKSEGLDTKDLEVTIKSLSGFFE